MAEDLSTSLRAALLTGDARGKVMATRSLVRRWRSGELATGFSIAMPDHPAWPDRVKVLPPSQMPKRCKGGSARNRIALWHSLAHIEFVAIDLALDIVGRFGKEMGEEFIADFLRVAADEAMHFALIDRHLATMGAAYGDLPVHAGLWHSAEETAHDVGARLAVVPMVLEARGLDVTPATLERVRGQGDSRGAKILQRILDDEIRHVAAGARHFERFCRIHGKTPENHWKLMVKQHFRGSLKPPFNDSARLAAGLSRDLYGSIA
ncbi:ferritin-like domain-containing protein [Aurantiacibacter poecillastricola]|uniref:ferritin-like domain-containing protein n=1 Tax=Aurantiacibacter poecillastricola TaxID=3064385 RepID=UPI00273EDD3B|nr:ferritin-like domain-containing protein [Aurantiacibacter sp. 219JJ12-13]MDP5260684.1 ferritin-like domain-containing protein [Aurantiacibacter sp. 219JJ12-13]